MMASHLHKRTLTKSLKNLSSPITPHKAWTGWRPDYSYMKEIGCKAFVLILAEHNPKIYTRSIECILIEYTCNSKAYRCYERATGKIYKTYHVKFHESHEMQLHPSTSTILNQPPLIEQIPHQSPTPNAAEDNLLFNSEGAPQNSLQSQPIKVPVQDQPPQLRRSSRILIPTLKAKPDKAPPSQVERAVRDSIAAGERV